VTHELALMDRADLLVLQYPMWWHLPPAMLKGWFDRVLAYGAVYTSKKRFENGRFAGKRAMLSVTVGTSRATYDHDGRSGDIDLLLWPVNFTLAYVGYEILAPYVSYGVEAGLRYSDPAAIEEVEGGRRGLPFRAPAPRRAGDDPVQPHGRVGARRPHRAGRPGPFAVRAAKKATGVGVTVWAVIALSRPPQGRLLPLREKVDARSAAG
jgi:Flavodoxin-like fold